MAKQVVILTDLETDVWLDKFRLSADDGPRLEGAANWLITKKALRGGVSDGVDVVSIDNGVFSVDVLPTRGMGLWRGIHRGTRLGWSSPARFPVHPSFVNRVDQRGLGWLSGFNEWMCRCGLSSLGDPCLDMVESLVGTQRESQVTLHGHIANTPCHRVSISVDDEGPGTLIVQGVMDEAWLYGPKLRLISTLKTVAGSSTLTIEDEVTNLGDEPGEMQLMYHTNLGRPLLEPGARLVVAAQEIAPYDESSARAIESWATFDGPTPTYEQRCYFMKPMAGEDGHTAVLFHNRARDKAIGLKFNTRDLPCFTLWKNLQGEGDGYLTGLEPGTCFPNTISFERKRQRVVALAPGGSYRTCLEIEIYDGEAAVSTAEKSVQRLMKQGPTLHRDIHPQYAPAGAKKA